MVATLETFLDMCAIGDLQTYYSQLPDDCESNFLKEHIKTINELHQYGDPILSGLT